MITDFPITLIMAISLTEDQVAACSGRSESQSPSRLGRQKSRHPQGTREGISRSTSRPRPRSEEIPMEDMMTTAGPQTSPSLPKVRHSTFKNIPSHQF